jgi:hypothetical protein
MRQTLAWVDFRVRDVTQARTLTSMGFSTLVRADVRPLVNFTVRCRLLNKDANQARTLTLMGFTTLVRAAVR